MALTAETWPEALQQIASHPFDRVYSKIEPENVAELLELINRKKSLLNPINLNSI